MPGMPMAVDLPARPAVTAWAGPALVSRAVREERRQIYSAPEVLETTNRYNENDGVSKRVHEPAFGHSLSHGVLLSKSDLSLRAPGSPTR